MRAGLPLLAVAVLSSGVARGDTVDPVVVRVGSAEVRASVIEARLRAMPGFQRRALGDPAALQRRVVEGTVVQDALFAAEAARLGLDGRPGVRLRIDEALRRTLVAELTREAEAAGVSDADIAAYYQANLAEYEKPERIRISRIVVADEVLAAKILAEARGKDGHLRWNALAREHSLDLSTKLRGGQLGFVAPNGHTDVPQLEVGAVLHAAATRVKDGELVPEPVREGERFAVVWRKGSLPAVRRALQDERESIRGLLVRQRVEIRLGDLVRDLEKSHVRDVDTGPLEALGLPVTPSPAVPASQIRAVPPPAASVDPVPRSTDQGLR